MGRCIHGRQLASRMDNPCREDHISCSTDAGKLLRVLMVHAQLAQLALHDEAEGKLRAEVFQLHELTTELRDLISSW